MENFIFCALYLLFLGLGAEYLHTRIFIETPSLEEPLTKT